MTRWLWLVWIGWLAACGAQDPSGPDQSDETGDADTLPGDDDGAPGDDDETPELPELRHCFGAPRPAQTTIEWNHTLTSVIILGSPRHDAQDTIVTGTGSGIISARFTYGASRADLADEWIEVLYDDCSGDLAVLDEAKTDDDGWLSLEVSASALPGYGSYALHLRVKGDDTAAYATLWFLPEATRLAVFDIDATLTTTDTALFQDLFDDIYAGDFVPEARGGAVDITNLRRSQGYIIAYVTGRPYWLSGRSRAWLTDLGFAPGPIRFAPSTLDAAPLESGVGDYKASYLTGLSDATLLLDLAYGNATTDIYAYQSAGIVNERTYILGDHGGEGETVALGEDYLTHLDEASDEEPAVQPFDG